MSRKVALLEISGFCFLLFVFFSYLVHKQLFVHMDFNTTVRFQDHISRRFDGIFSSLSVIGSFEPMVLLLIGILLFRRKLWGILVLIFFGILHLFELYGKTFVNHHPPPEFMLRTEHLVNFPQFHVSEVYSYPSGHAGRSIFLTLLLGGIIWYSKRLSSVQKLLLISVLVVYEVVMIVSRIYLGEHWTTDVIGGTLLGASLSLVSLIFVL